MGQEVGEAEEVGEDGKGGVVGCGLRGRGDAEGE